MLAGRKTRTFPLMEKSEMPWTANMSGSVRNLTKDKLGSVMCKDHTIMECLDNKLFGLPAPHYSYVKNVSIGLRLYLFNYSDRKLHGIFEAVSTGQMNINQYAWAASEGVESTPYPSQVRVREQSKCRPLHEDEFKPIIASNYYKKRLFWFELDREQDERLMKLYLSSQLPEKVPRVPNGLWKKAFECLSSSNVNKGAVEMIKYENSEEYSGATEVRLRENEDSFTSVSYTSSLDSEKKWSELLKPSSSSCVVKSVEDFIDQNVELLSSRVDCFDNEPKFVLSLDGWSKLPHEACMSDCDPSAVRSCDGSAFEDDKVKETLYDSKDQYSHCQDPDCDKLDMTETSSENRRFSDEEGEFMPSELDCLPPEGKALIYSKEEIISETDLKVVENCERSQDKFNLTNKALPWDTNAMPEEEVLKSFNNQELIAKLVQDVGVLKLSQVKQRLRIESLEHDLIYSKVEIDRLNSMISSTKDYKEDRAFPNFKLEEPVFIVGGFNGSSWLSDLSLYSQSKDHIISLCPMTFPRSRASLAKLNGELYLFGGAHEGLWYDTVESYNPFTNQWTQKPSLNRKKGCMAGVSMYETIFAIGGGNGVGCFDEVELFDQHIGSWICTTPMLEKRLDHAAANLNCALYVAGGYDGRNYVRSVERFDPRQHVWTNLSGMNLKRACHSLVAYNDKLYALGGYDGDTMVSSVEVLDPRTGSWMMAEPMKAPRGYFSSLVIGGRIYVIGGVHDTKVLDMVEYYIEDSGWHELGVTALGKRSFSSAIV